MAQFIFIHDLVNPETGLTYTETGFAEESLIPIEITKEVIDGYGAPSWDDEDE